MKNFYIHLEYFFVISPISCWLCIFPRLIYETGLNPEFTDAENVGTAVEDRVLIDSIAKDTIKLNVEGRTNGDLFSENGIYGIIGQNGEAIVGKILSGNGNVIERELLQVTGTLVSRDRIIVLRGLIRQDNDGTYKILGSSGWSGQATDGVYTPESVSEVDYEDIFYESDVGSFSSISNIWRVITVL